ncbi:lysylphosphatidylglycerol synthase domain-containing protein [Streptomyces sp. NPDC056796]|uniref:lysylphosphatidylglycerol synthase domain-containing protein n=1 Tax=Streptomyces sp. NPDC056796 TaxID=3345947 RepID=UPI00367FF87A
MSSTAPGPPAAGDTVSPAGRGHRDTLRDFARRPWVRGTATAVVLAVCAGFLVHSFARDGEATRTAVGLLGPVLPLALVPALAGLWLTALSWREPLQALSVPLSRPSAVRIFAAGQLGKYVPGVMWSIVLQSRLAAASGITVFHFTAAFGLYAAVSLGTGGVLGLASLARHAYGTGAALVAAALVPVLLLLLPRLLAASVRLVKVVPALARRLAPVPLGVLRRSVWLCAASWLVTGVHLWLFAVALGADPLRAVLPCVAGFAVATSLSSLVVVVPDGLGVREALLAVSLASVLPAPEAAAAAAASRLVLAAADVLAFGYGSLAARTPHPQPASAAPLPRPSPHHPRKDDAC